MTSETALKLLIELAWLAFFVALACRGYKLADEVQEQRFRESLDILRLRGVRVS